MSFKKELGKMTKLIAKPEWRMVTAAIWRTKFSCCNENGICGQFSESLKMPLGSVETARYKKFLTSQAAGFNLDRR
jgi:hypothetical protein